MPAVDERQEIESSAGSDLSRERTGHAALKLMVTRAVTATATLFLSRGLLSRHFDKADLGIFNEAMTFASLLPMVFMLGLPKAIYYFYPRTTERRSLLLLSGAVALMTGALGAAAFYLLAPAIGALLGNSALGTHALTISAYVAACVVAQLVDPILISRGRTSILSLSVILTGAVNLLLLYLTVRQGWGVSSLLWALAALQLIPAFFGLAGIPGSSNHAGTPAPTLGALFSYILPIAASSLSMVLMSYLDKFFAMHSFPGDHERYGTYTTGAMEIPIVASIVYSGLAVLMPRYSEAHHRGDHRAVASLYQDVTSALATAVAPIFGFFLVFGGTFVIWLHSDRYTDSVPVFLVYIFFVPLRIFGADVLLQAMGEARVMVRYAAYGLVFNFLLAATLTWSTRWLVAPAISTVFATALFLCILPLRRAAAKLGLPISELLPLKKYLRLTVALVISLGIAWSFLFVAEAQGAPRLAILILGGLLFLAGYIGAIFACGVVSRADCRRLLQQFRPR